MTRNDDLPPPKADFSAPPPYELSQQQDLQNRHHPQQQQPQQIPTTQTTQVTEGQPQIVGGAAQGIQSPTSKPSSKLPTYEEVQNEKTLLGELPAVPPLMDLPHNTVFPIHGRVPPPSHPVLISALRNAHAGNGVGQPGVNPGALTFIAIDAADGRHHGRGVGNGPSAGAITAVDNSLLGTDVMFVTAFLVAFLFNWIGFLMLTCFFHTIAARYGALAGFGLSLAKWTLIVKHSTDLASHENSWLWWLIMAFGLLICVRALAQYISIKRTWRLLSAPAQERLLFFY